MVDKILKQYQKKLSVRLDNDDTYDDQDVKEVLILTDPTPNNKFVRWIVDSYVNDGILTFDDMIPSVKPALEEYTILSKSKKLKKGKAKWENEYNIDNYCGIAGCKKKGFEKPGLDDLLDQYGEVLEGMKEVVDERGDYEEYCNNSDVRVIIPKNQEAACYYGQGTKWCTAAREDNQFDYYSQWGTLYIVLPKNPTYVGEKYQLHFEDNQFNDEKDSPVDLGEILERHRGIYDCLVEVLKIYEIIMDPSKLELIETPTQEFLLYLIQRNGNVIEYIDNPSDELKWAAVQQNGHSIRYIDNPSEELKMAAVQENGLSIRGIDNPSEELKMAAVQGRGISIRDIDNPSEELKLAAVQQNGRAIQYIKNPSEELKLAAVRQDGDSVRYIDNPSEEVQLVAVQQEPYAIEYIVNPSEESQLAAVRQKGLVIELIENPSEEVQFAAVKNDPDAIEVIENPSERVQLAAQ